MISFKEVIVRGFPQVLRFPPHFHCFMVVSNQISNKSQFIPVKILLLLLLLGVRSLHDQGRSGDE